MTFQGKLVGWGYMEQIYELAYLLSADMSEEKAEEITEKIEAILKAEKAKIIKSEKPRKIRLSYPIKKHEGAFLVSQRFQMEQTQAISLKQNVEKIPEIIRFLIVKREPNKPDLPKEKPIRETKKEIKEMSEIEKELDEVLK